jgi:hypothetical protein
VNVVFAVNRLRIEGRRMAKKPIMSADEEQYMAFEGLVQWTQAVVTQSARVSARDQVISKEVMLNPVTRRVASLAFHSECNFFAIAVHKIFEYRDWAVSFGLCASVDFGEIDQFSAQDIRDLRNMREHVVDYFKGEGNSPGRWFFEMPNFKADASSVMGTMIGGRLDRIKFGVRSRTAASQIAGGANPFSES